MRIAVVSPHTTHNGTTTLAMLIAFGFASTDKLTCLGHIKPTSDTFYRYLNFVGYDDKTSTPSQIVKIIKEGSLPKDDIRDYCKRVSNNLEAFTNNSSNFSQDDMNYMIEYMIESFPHDHLIIDMDDNNITQNKKVIDLCDVVVINVTQSVSELKDFYENKDSILNIIGNKPIVVVINKYNSVKGTIKETANWMGIKRPNNWLVLHENPWITWATNHGTLTDLFKQIKSKDSRVIELDSEISKICETLIKAKANKDRRSGGHTNEY